VSGPAGVVVLEDDRSGLPHEEFQNIEAVVQVGEVDLSRMLSLLEHVLFPDGTDQSPVGLDEAALPQFQVSAHQLVQRRFLSRILSVSQTLFDEFPRFLVGEFPASLAIRKVLVPEENTQGIGEMVFHDRSIHLLQVFWHNRPSIKKGPDFLQTFL